MNIFLPLIGILLINAVTPYQSDLSKGRFGGEVFFLNLEDGYFGCQVNESTDYLQLYDLSKLCDGTQDCYLGSDEKNKELKCTNNCDKDGTQCTNGVCLNGVCHCNDGFGGCNCQVADENECKYRPCDVFAHCTNTLGSFTCTCFPGYLGDGLHCEDIDECQDPKISSRCVENAECCNLPAHFLCKCKPGYEGDGEVACTDIDECLSPNACGSNAICSNTPGNYTCECPEGYEGNPFSGCIDIDECTENPNICENSQCVNLLGSYRCECPQGFEIDISRDNSCVDVNECLKSPCGRNAQCSNSEGGFKCSCLDGYSGDAMTECSAACLLDTECDGTEICNAGKCISPCDLLTPCGINAECRSFSHSKECLCPPNFTGNPEIECVRIPIGCSGNSECSESYSCVNNMCLPTCSSDHDCALNEKCLDGQCLLSCRVDNDCFLGHICLNNKCSFGCHSDDDCSSSESCRDNKCVNICSESPCGINSVCSVNNHRALCTCLPGLVPNPTAQIGCVRSSPLSCTKNSECPDQLMCINSQCMTLCASDEACFNKEKCVDGTCKSVCGRDDECSSNEICLNQICEQGCRSNQGCPLHLSCLGNQCINPCEDANACGTNALCEVREHNKYCLCREGLVGNPEEGCRTEVVKCSEEVPCGPNKQCYAGVCQSKCRNDQNCLNDEKCVRGMCRTVCNSDEYCSGQQICENRLCQIGCRNDNMCPSNQSCVNKKCKNPCEIIGQCGSCSECSVVNHSVQCSCPAGFIGDGTSSCIKSPEICNDQCQCDEHGQFCAGKCSRSSDCSCGEICHTGKCRLKCSKNKPCPIGQRCERGGACVGGCNKNTDCNFNNVCEAGQCVNPCEKDNACGKNALCTTTNHQLFCYCPDGFKGEPNEECKKVECESNTECDLNQRCENGVCINPCLEQGVCGINAQCKVVNRVAECLCPPNYIGNPKSECESINTSKCSKNPCGTNSVCKDSLDGYECTCMSGCYGDAHKGCICGDDHTTICSSHQCGKNALCQVNDNSYPECYCPQNYPYGDPNTECAPYPPQVKDCRTKGCSHGECIRQGTEYICKQEIDCKSNDDCSTQNVCINSLCVDPCLTNNLCKSDEVCFVDNHQMKCSSSCECKADKDCKSGMQCDGCNCLQSRDTSVCDHCNGNPCDPITGACINECTVNEDCELTEACVNHKCEIPCEIQSTCGYNAVCVNANHGTDCKCLEGYQGNPYVGCQLVLDYKSVCQYNEDCPPYQLCDRLNRRCMNACSEDSCGENANCIAENHGYKCECPLGYGGNPNIECELIQGCKSNSECNSYEACINGKCGSPCKCGSNALCDVTSHKAKCKCPTGYSGNPLISCLPPSNPCEPNPCGTGAICELDKGNPICYCPKGLTGNPFKACIPDGNECAPDHCGENSGCRVVNGNPICFCLPQYEGSPPSVPCKLPSNPCNPSPCGPNTQCTIIRKGFSKCTCLPGYIESPNTIRGCIEPVNECEPNPCGLGAICDASKSPKCYCPGNTVGNPFRQCIEPPKEISLCNPGPCGINANCYIEQSARETCYCIDGYYGDPYTGCKESTKAVGCDQSACGINAHCIINEYGDSVCVCENGMVGDPYDKRGCHGFECQTSDDCPNDKTCMGYKCHDPCPGHCGVNADCKVDAHHPVCYCKSSLVGNPNVRCYSLAIEPAPKQNPCNNACGLNTECNVLNNRAVCSCIKNYLGDPQTGCHPECVINSDCSDHQSCINKKCVDPCTGTICGINSICKVLHNTPYCQCSEGFTGDALSQCFPVSRNITKDPCTPSPCGPQDICTSYNSDVALCNPCFGSDALYNPHCRPECLSNSECPFDKACLSNKCIDPCQGACGPRARCQVIRHKAMCLCPEGLHGNPYEQCVVPSIIDQPENVNCNNIQCGANAHCKTVNKISKCVCKSGYHGNPQLSCYPECTINPDCPFDQACVNSKCINPCLSSSTCGRNAKCSVINHTPLCSCEPGYEGNAYIECKHIYLPPGKDVSPCEPSPCGPNSRCLVSPEGHAACSCLPNFKGAPPFCQYECVINSDCPQDKSCLDYKCKDPCVGVCGVKAVCRVYNHNPICSCDSGYEGDPFTACYPPPENKQINPCTPSPCGPNSICQVKFDRPVCSCIKNYIGVVPHCRPECSVNSDCPQNKACINDKCQNPCTNACGLNAKCVVVNHGVNCVCEKGYVGDAFIGCSRYIEPSDMIDPCHNNPCAQNALCKVQNNAAKCVCISPYIGDPYSSGCKPECVYNSDCPSTLSCIRQHCRNPCTGLCGAFAECKVTNNVPSCNCINGYEGDPFAGCTQTKITPQSSPCDERPCGPNSICRNINGRPACSCQTGFLGTPPYCRPECTVNSECKQHLSCINRICQDPCQGSVCGINALCKVHYHNPICSCKENYVGDPFERCIPGPAKSANPCNPNPCGPNSECKETDNHSHPVCSCSPGMFGIPPNCRPECIINQDCPSNRVCIRNKCEDPCAGGSCGINARCEVINHNPVCNCMERFEGDPYAGCNPERVIDITHSPCSNNPCGVNAICKEQNGIGACVCLPEYYGNPYINCKPECIVNSECDRTKSCVNMKCINPCLNSCGLNSECNVINHRPVCSCPEGYSGNPLELCVIETKVLVPSNPCSPSPCGINSICRIKDNRAVCRCLPNFLGSPPNCRPECVINSDCGMTSICLNSKCIDPCTEGVCGLHAECRVVNRAPICTCINGYSGDPFNVCHPEKLVNIEPIDACNPSPCGPNSICKRNGLDAVCACVTNFIGRPPNCRPQCTINSQCPMHLSCVNNKCVDPCISSCGNGARCRVTSHIPRCYCEQGYTGDPFSNCIPIVEPIISKAEPVSPCQLSLCGINAVCSERNEAFSCKCIQNYIGDPHIECRPECIINNECPITKSCINNKCVNPCIDMSCGSFSKCFVLNHMPMCVCEEGYSGNPYSSCNPIIIKEEIQVNPCNPSPCGPNSNCRAVDNIAVCSCVATYIGSPPNCRPECVLNSDCSQNKLCKNHICIDPCTQATCGLDSECKTIGHRPICSCRQGYTGDPFINCVPVTPQKDIYENSCIPSPCGPNSQCTVIREQPVCSCISGFIGTAPNCRHECTSDSECSPQFACINFNCKDPCLGTCGPNALCTVKYHKPICTCKEFYYGDPYSICSLIIATPKEEPNPCFPSPCGDNAECKERNGVGSCSCLPSYQGDPYVGCRPECVLNTDCSKNLACKNNKCENPCEGLCGHNAECYVINHAPICHCLPDFTGNPSTSCIEIKKDEERNPCRPSPCGPYSSCIVKNNHAICSCLKDYTGSPPACRPECLVSSECQQTKACINQKCVDPCVEPYPCGRQAVCNVINHNPICSCPEHFTGDPFSNCVELKIFPDKAEDPCLPTPCGPNSKCKVINSVPVCSCLPNYIGRAPNCRPECTLSTECPSNSACVNNKCVDPCLGSCGYNAVCNVINHLPNCLCQTGYSGDPYSGCNITPKIEYIDPCNPSPCGPNAECKEKNGAGSCICLPEYQGDPYAGCRPECVLNSDCAAHLSCKLNKCKDPCSGACGENSLCEVVNHAPICSCMDGFTGNPLISCQKDVLPVDPSRKDTNLCDPSPCGPYSQCKEVNNNVACSCLPNFIGSPPNCKPECIVSSDCPQNKNCNNQKCVDPCVGACGSNANCLVINHYPSCSCSSGYEGDPFKACNKIKLVIEPENPCLSSPCGPHSKCVLNGETAACSCLPNYIGRPPHCRPECMSSSDCDGTLACSNHKCINPCLGACGVNTICNVMKHNPICQCENGYTGDPFSGCTVIIENEPTEAPVSPCEPSPCGVNALCKEQNGIGSCACVDDYVGNPYTGCRPECVQNSDCDNSRACLNNKCRDPCQGSCGVNSDCRVYLHAPLCQCMPGYTGNPMTSCNIIPTEVPLFTSNPCKPSPCGPYSQCRIVVDQAVCSCSDNFIGSPPNCKPECIVSSECPQNQGCIDQRCKNPCQTDTCGLNARCHVINHNPICTCATGFSGDPFVSCTEVAITTEKSIINACEPSPCGPYSKCLVKNNQPVCTCKENFVGRPPFCRPECSSNDDCENNLACINDKCIDPCLDSCGLNADCKVIRHNAICVCRDGYEGDPFSQCHAIEIVSEKNVPITPCTPNPCGPNAECREQNEAGACFCRNGFEGNPYDLDRGCRHECEVNSDCALNNACVKFKCINPCVGICGTYAICTIDNHIPDCTCPPGMTGDPLFQCTEIAIPPAKSADPCSPSPCGPNSICKEINKKPVCSCHPDFSGSPPNCRPECIVSSECPSTRACINNKCADPCPHTCGSRAQCNTINHSPICSCPAGLTGDPFSQCSPIAITVEPEPTAKPPSCVPSPCGPNSQCQIIGQSPACSCQPGYIGTPPHCRPECAINSECQSSEACINLKCKDPCTAGVCGIEAKCHVQNHIPICTCLEGYSGDPFSQCVAIPIEKTPIYKDKCNPSPCGSNAICMNGDCKCQENYFGNPFERCVPECTLSSDCPRDKTCLRNKCVDPCHGGLCGRNAKCEVVNHIPTCSCFEHFEGDPFNECREIIKLLEPTDPCNPSPCGPNSQCRNINEHAVCSCSLGYLGNPPNCRPECVVNSECSSFESCHNKKCVNPCQENTCGVDAKCEVINHSPICACTAGKTGDPFRGCYDIIEPPPPKNIQTDPCYPSPCGPNSQCKATGEHYVCQCLQDFIGTPPNCRPECIVNSDCVSNNACINSKCQDPCKMSGVCGLNSECRVLNHILSCSCPSGYVGNAFVQCLPREEPISKPCDPSPCGPNAICEESNTLEKCRCIEDFLGDPYSINGCRPECVINSECPSNQACVNNKCADPCGQSICGNNAKCYTTNHVPSCVCSEGYEGDAINGCYSPPSTPTIIKDPCYPSPCGQNSECKNIDNFPVCTCQENFIGAPPNCRPECIINSDCSANTACHKYKCRNPCESGACGINSKCDVINHYPICSCPTGMTGDPFSKCVREDFTPPAPKNEDPCTPSPCGLYSNCLVAGSHPVCSCLQGYVGTAPNCRPECVVNSDCPIDKTCLSEKCVNPCDGGACGFYAQCRVQNHVAICSCDQGYTGDPFIQCTRLIEPPKVVQPDNTDPCSTQVCGSNSVCRNGACACKPDYFGDPYVGCRPECVFNTDCSPNKACINKHCVDPCTPSTCGRDAICEVSNHIPICSCRNGYEGDPFKLCRVVEKIIEQNPCQPTPCGPNSNCLVKSSTAVCSCQIGMTGSPPYCKPECVVSSECNLNQACINQKCVDPCPGSCALNSICRVTNHIPICMCDEGFTGNPFIDCRKIIILPEEPKNPCTPSPCGPNSICNVRNNLPICQCSSGYMGSPPNCRPECTINPECPSDKACIRHKCENPCTDSCGVDSKCEVANHIPICSCDRGYTGDPFVKCVPIPAKPILKEETTLCNPNPCGVNSECFVKGNSYSCKCIRDYIGNPFEECRPECVENSQCLANKACINSKCLDPCATSPCGIDSECYVNNHIPVCVCIKGYTGDAFKQCTGITVRENDCDGNICGPNAQCKIVNGRGICECLSGFFGDPYNIGCKPECVISSDCPKNKLCLKSKCVDPCEDGRLCGYGARCTTVSHNPICSCPPSTEGNPFIECHPREKEIQSNPCYPSPCSENGICKLHNGNPICIYPECITNEDCASNLACLNKKCNNPCESGAVCGVNSICETVNHNAICICPNGYTGSPYVICEKKETGVIIEKPECTIDNDCPNHRACVINKCIDPCSQSNICARNAHCTVQNHRPLCNCNEGYGGNAQISCYKIECQSDSECPLNKACVNEECINPCIYTKCGENAICRTDYHKSRCYCNDEFFGNPLVRCSAKGCTSNNDCDYNLACINKKCQDPCVECGQGAECTVNNHISRCQCPIGYEGDPKSGCITKKIDEKPECVQDKDCSSKLACITGVCTNPCNLHDYCGRNSKCNVVDTLPVRTMVCECLPGFTNTEKGCEKVIRHESECTSNYDCPSEKICQNEICINPCLSNSPCAKTASCNVDNHSLTCKCPPGFNGDPFYNCYEEKSISAGCTSDSECPINQACINKLCQNPCSDSRQCDQNSECRAVNHRPVCVCPIGWSGNPQVQCYKPECKINSDCFDDKKCVNEKCVNPCLFNKCGLLAKCIPRNHEALCVCPDGKQGDPYISCVTSQCQYNEDCPDDELCDRLNRVCRPACDENSCTENTECIGRSHQPNCRCKPGTIGNPYIECIRPKNEIEVECTVDDDCSKSLICYNHKCENPCITRSPCSNQQNCEVFDHSPIKTIICKCPPDTTNDNKGNCIPVYKDTKQFECEVNEDCSDSDVCVRGICTLACRVERCGVNAICQSISHYAVCSCPDEYEGNPRIECNRKYITQIARKPECETNDECHSSEICKNSICVNPCLYQNPCSPNAFCHIDNRRAICRCPPNYIGDPYTTGCNPKQIEAVLGCKSNSECKESESCINSKCVSPCNCGVNANCIVRSHHPVCVCENGFFGNAQIGCYKVGCTSDSECSDDKKCLNNQCINTCSVNNPCTSNAECYGINHQSDCKCLRGYSGNGFIKCERVGCKSDYDCPSNKACHDEKCVDLCLLRNHCAHNAECYMQNHQTKCRCPPELPDGNPYSYCEKQKDYECRQDKDCPNSLACIDNQCKNACHELSPCAKSADCSVLDSIPVRTMICQCPKQQVPDANGECTEIVLKTPGCVSNDDCTDNEACINNKCRDPCNCANNSQCQVKNHRAICSCEPGFEGNPYLSCQTIGCRSNNECESNKACINGDCINECLINSPCGPNAECYMEQNRPLCRCKSGYRGNPFVECKIIECLTNSDCPTNKQCSNEKCINPCIYNNKCGAKAECFVQNHKDICRCPQGYYGNPFVKCMQNTEECVIDSDCPESLACINARCVNPCHQLEPCSRPSTCAVISSKPMRTMICTCPDGYVSSGSGTCKPTKSIVEIGCISDVDCDSTKTCVAGICKNPCDSNACGSNAECRIKDHKPICTCAQGYEGNPEIRCIRIQCTSNSECSSTHTCINKICVPACQENKCGKNAECFAVQHTSRCECLPGFTGNPSQNCLVLGCRANSDCPSNKACVNNKCENPCDSTALCSVEETCKVYNHKPECICPNGQVLVGRRCQIERTDICLQDSECPSKNACISGECVNPCEASKPCGVNADCKVLDTVPVRTMICECKEGYQGNAAVQCDKKSTCLIEKGFVRDINGRCVCPPGKALDIYNFCSDCIIENGFAVNGTNHCICDLERGMIIDVYGKCRCPTEHGYKLTPSGECVPFVIPECTSDAECSNKLYCNLETQHCEDPCLKKTCGINAFCDVVSHEAVCQCITGYNGNPYEFCNHTNFRTDFPRPDMVVSCLADGVSVQIHITEPRFNGVLYVKGHSKEEECRKVVNLSGDTTSRTELFKVQFGDCGLIHDNGIANFILVIQKHPKLVTYKAQAYNIKCVYQTGEKNVTLGFNVSMLTTAGTIANTGPPPVCQMRIVTQTGQEINSAEIGDNLMLQVDIEPATIYGGFARSCIAKTMEDNVENEYVVTDENGCATEPSIFGEWEYNPDTNSLLASFNAFKFPSSDNIRFQCNIRVCFGKCQPVNCRGYNAFGRRRRREISSNESTEISVGGNEGQLREEITIQSNAILTFDKKESYTGDYNIKPSAQRVEDICVSMVGLIIALVITALLALVAVAIAVSCWLMAYRRTPKSMGPLPHPPEFPNPLFTNPEAVSEPAPDYIS